MREWPFGRLRPFKYNLIVADPPWRFKTYSDNGLRKSAAAHYPVMRLEEICDLPVGQLAGGDCLLLLWACGCMLPEALKVMGRWGFAFKSELVWEKTTARGKTHFGTGYRVRSMHEPVLLGTVGNPIQACAFPSHFNGLHRGHSFKPDEFYDLIADCCPGLTSRADLFHDPMRERPGWDGWGHPRRAKEEAL
jgi:N6-adenosine-specific RNA methylase IME4